MSADTFLLVDFGTTRVKAAVRPASAAVLEKLSGRRVVSSGSRGDETIAGLAILTQGINRQ